jgi:hypothetical protein
VGSFRDVTIVTTTTIIDNYASITIEIEKPGQHKLQISQQIPVF